MWVVRDSQCCRLQCIYVSGICGIERRMPFWLVERCEKTDRGMEYCCRLRTLMRCIGTSLLVMFSGINLG